MIKSTLEIPSRFHGDPIGDSAFIWLKEHPKIYQQFSNVVYNSELSQFAEGFGPLSELCKEVLYTDVCFNPSATGAKFFERHADDILAILGLYSLPYCYAGAKGARVLYASKKIKDDPFRRLLETAEFVFETCRLGAYEQKGRGLVSIAKVRLMHSAARYYASRTIMDETPVNQEDLVGTLLSFSLLVIRGLKKIGINVSDADTTAYMELWAFIGVKMGIRTEIIPTDMRTASQLERAIRKKEFKQSEEGRQLFESLVKCMGAQEDLPTYLDIEYLMAYFLGEEVSNVLGVKNVKAASEIMGLSLSIKGSFKQMSSSRFGLVVKSFEHAKTKAGVKPDYKYAIE